jgi:peptidoglycan/xylan/chitin deacetylase (PgdA/CDA1 family)
VAGLRPRWFRPPHGKLSEASFNACRDLGLGPVYWTAGAPDWRTISARDIAARVCRHLEDGAIILLHDSPLYSARPDARPTAEAVRTIVAEGRTRGLDFVTLCEAVGPPGADLRTPETAAARDP